MRFPRQLYCMLIVQLINSKIKYKYKNHRGCFAESRLKILNGHSSRNAEEIGYEEIFTASSIHQRKLNTPEDPFECILEIRMHKDTCTVHYSRYVYCAKIPCNVLKKKLQFGHEPSLRVPVAAVEGPRAAG